MRRITPFHLRIRAIERARQQLLQRSFPRAQMALIVALTGGAGLLASFALLQLGVDSMAARYPLSLLLAYPFFLFLIWLWLRTNVKDYLDAPLDASLNAPDIAGLMPRPRLPTRAPDFRSGGGGDFAGGGASGSFDVPAGAFDPPSSTPLPEVGDALGAVAEADEFAVPVLAIGLALGISLASLYVVYIAPVLFAEVLVDGALSYALFRHLPNPNQHHWLSSTVRRTGLAFAATAAFLGAVGLAMGAYAPGATTLGQVVKHAGAKHADAKRATN